MKRICLLAIFSFFALLSVNLKSAEKENYRDGAATSVQRTVYYVVAGSYDNLAVGKKTAAKMSAPLDAGCFYKTTANGKTVYRYVVGQFYSERQARGFVASINERMGRSAWLWTSNTVLHPCDTSLRVGCGANADTQFKFYVCTTGNAYVREGPGSNYRIITDSFEMPTDLTTIKGDGVLFLGKRKNGYMYVSLSGSAVSFEYEGWVEARYLKPVCARCNSHLTDEFLSSELYGSEHYEYDRDDYSCYSCGIRY
jgi:hypothetical protein